MIARITRERHGDGRNMMLRMLKETALLIDIKALVTKRKRARNV